MATYTIDLRGVSQDAKIAAFNKALAEGKTEREADSIANDAGMAAQNAVLNKVEWTNPSTYSAAPAGTVTTDGVTNNATAPAPNDQPGVAESKTDKPSSGQTSTTPTSSTGESTPSNVANNNDKYSAATEKNVLYKYRSWTYNYALGAVSPDAISNPSLMARDIKKYPVLDSAGKGTSGVGVGASTLTNSSQLSGLVGGFNSNSPGRFDMFIDNLEMESVVKAGTPESGPSVVTNIKFEVFEPYSMNGFIEALMVTAKAAGYKDHVDGYFALRLQFQGYPDNQSVESSRPEIIPQTTRYFILRIINVGITVTEAGTKYSIEAVPQPQMGFGLTNVLSADIKVAGTTIGEVLTNFAKALNDMSEEESKARKSNGIYNTYEISAPKLSTVGSPQNVKKAILSSNTSTNAFQSDVLKAKMNDELKSPNVFKMGDPAQFVKGGYVGTIAYGATTSTQGTASATSSPTGSTSAPPNSQGSTNSSPDPTDANSKLTPKTGTFVFAAGSKIHECIAAVVRDSEYVRDLMKPESLNKAKQGDGMLTYFNVRLESELGRFDQNENKHVSKFRYVLEPFQIHFTEVPGQDQGTHSVDKIKGKIKREYNYIYTGKNEDVLKFNLNFNNLYFATVAPQGGNPTEELPTKSAAGPGGQLEIKTPGSNATANDKNSDGAKSIATAPATIDPNLVNKGNQSARAGQPLGDPYAQMANLLHEKVLSGVNLITGTLEILGDPYFLTSGAMQNGDLVLADKFLTAPGPNNTGGEAPTTQGPVYVNLNFRNPIDIDPRTGLMTFSTLISFSGIYQVTLLKNSFRGGVFTQAMELVRIPGQIVGKGTPVLANNPVTKPYPGLQPTKDTSLATILKEGIRPSDFNLANLINRGLPSIGLPGNLSNFTNAITGAVGQATALAGQATAAVNSVVGTANGVLNQVSGVIGQANALTSQLGVSPLGGVNALTSGIRLSASGLGSLTALPNLAASSIASAGNAIGTIANIPNAAAGLANNVIGSVQAVTANVTGEINNLTQSVTGIVNNVQSNVASLVGGVGDKIAQLQNLVKTDVAAIGEKLGIDPSVFSGLDPAFASKITDQLASVAKNVPDNTNLGDLVKQGVSFAQVTGEKLKNLPAIQPKDIAPAAILDPALGAIATVKGNITSLISNASNFPPLTTINGVTNALGAVSAGATAALGNAQAILGSVASAQQMVNNTIGQAVGIANNVGSLAQNTIQGLSSAQALLGSVESNINNISQLTQNVTKTASNLGISVANQFGSLQQSPLTKLVQNNNIQGSV